MKATRHQRTTPAGGPSARALVAGLALAFALGTFTPDAYAAPDWRRNAQEQLKPNNLAPGISLEQAASIVRRRTGGRVLSASPSEHGDQRGYDIRVLVDGKRVKDYFVDTQGRVRSRN